MWKTLSCSRKELNLELVLSCGQSFRWKQSKIDHDIWVGVLNEKLWFLKQDDEGNVIYKTVNGNASSCTDEDDSTFLKEYFQLDVDVGKLYENWSKNDRTFQDLSLSFSGIRILRQDPVENLFSFICSQNNNINRITQLVEKLCENYGKVITSFEDQKYYSFPDVSDLPNVNVEAKLRQLGFGYRAKFIQKTANAIMEKPGGVNWLYDMRCEPYKEAHEGLCSLPGVGPKVADCVCLMSLDKHDAIPIDTHIWQIAVRDYLPHLKKMKTITDKSYREIGDFLRERFGEYAGWAQSVLFSSELKKFQDLKELDQPGRKRQSKFTSTSKNATTSRGCSSKKAKKTK